jgi:hypothetical protein
MYESDIFVKFKFRFIDMQIFITNSNTYEKDISLYISIDTKFFDGIWRQTRHLSEFF